MSKNRFFQKHPRKASLARAYLAVGECRQELGRVFAKRQALDVLIWKKQQRLALLSAALGENCEVDQLKLYSLANAVRTVFKCAPTRNLTVREIVQGLQGLSFPIRAYANFQDSLDSVLRHLCSSNEMISTGARNPESVRYAYIARFGEYFSDSIDD